MIYSAIVDPLSLTCVYVQVSVLDQVGAKFGHLCGAIWIILQILYTLVECVCHFTKMNLFKCVVIDAHSHHLRSLRDGV